MQIIELNPNCGDSQQKNNFWFCVSVYFTETSTYDYSSDSLKFKPTVSDPKPVEVKRKRRSKLDSFFLKKALKGKKSIINIEKAQIEIEDTLSKQLQLTNELKSSEISDFFKEKEPTLPNNSEFLPGADRNNTYFKILNDEVLNFTITSPKSTPTQSLSMTLIETKSPDPYANFFKVFATGSWVLFYCFDSEKKYTEQIQRIRRVLEKGQNINCNYYDSGLKFVGRVSSIETSIKVTEQGHKTQLYNVACVGLPEFNYNIYADTRLLSLYGDVYNKLIAFVQTGEIKKLFGEGKNPTSPNTIIPVLLEQCFKKNGTINPTSSPLGNTFDPNTKCLVPNQVAALFGTKGKSFFDILQVIMGVEEYGGMVSEIFNPEFESNPSKQVFFTPNKKSYHLLPDVVKDNNNPNVYHCNKQLQGKFIYNLIPSDTSVWEYLKTYVNTPVEECYVALRPGLDGVIRPTLTVRQLPFNTSALRDIIGPKYPVTVYTEMSRWKLSMKRVTSINYGVNDTIKFNYALLSPVAIDNVLSDESKQTSIATGLTGAIVDTDNIARYGLRKAIARLGVNTGYESVQVHTDNKNNLMNWQAIFMDAFAEENLRYNGSIACDGITEPIAPGDNIECANIIFHIESVTHTGSIGTDGTKDFRTTLNVCHGVPVPKQ